MAKYSKSFIEARFKHAATVMGWNVGSAWTHAPDGKVVANIGAVYLDHVPMFGGWDINQIVNEGGAIRQINGWANRMKASELVAFFDGIILAAEHAAKREDA